jgi:hypothetical protein
MAAISARSNSSIPSNPAGMRYPTFSAIRTFSMASIS